MNQDEAGQQLHDRATRGEMLSAEETTVLDQWYARHDQEEVRVLAQANQHEGLVSLRAEVESAMTRLASATERIQQLNAENEAVRREILSLEQRLVQKATA